MSEYPRRHRIYKKAQANALSRVMPDDLATSPVAGALVMIAVQPWAKDYEDHMMLAAGAFDACCNGFVNVEVVEAARDKIVEFIKQAGKGK